MPPRMWSRAAVSCRERPAALIGSAHWATAEPTRTQVERTPTTGEKGSIFLTCQLQRDGHSGQYGSAVQSAWRALRVRVCVLLRVAC